ncbi:unnamed protein product [Darwinula stevensoni]|uniref:Uncharacterized protein n=1 Tax=Darwinula stevensoni TaxID=69355 RepID=A0A7R9AD03_9CRUS|nr:unnamed protein product [Darwinula stevensoni]CAG0900842.1 unnamed protein product [Darwinula stevensoni]
MRYFQTSSQISRSVTCLRPSRRRAQEEVEVEEVNVEVEEANVEVEEDDTNPSLRLFCTRGKNKACVAMATTKRVSILHPSPALSPSSILHSPPPFGHVDTPSKSHGLPIRGSQSGAPKMNATFPHQKLSSFCGNLTATIGELMGNLSTILQGESGKDDDASAVVYIVVVLSFYSLGIVVMIFKYMQKEKREFEETKMYSEYLEAARSKNFQSRFRPMNRLALNALNTVNVFPAGDSSRVTFV